MTENNRSPDVASLSRAIVTAIGGDRPGLVEEFSQFIFQHRGNIEDSRMVNLRGEFAMLVLVSGSAQILGDIERDLSQLISSTKLHAQFRRLPGSAETMQPVPAMPYRLIATAMDQAGLVHRIAHLLRHLHVNIENLDSRLEAAPYTGAPVFEMELMISVPQTTPISKVRAELTQLCDEMNIDWHLEAA